MKDIVRPKLINIHKYTVTRLETHTHTQTLKNLSIINSQLTIFGCQLSKFITIMVLALRERTYVSTFLYYYLHYNNVQHGNIKISSFSFAIKLLLAPWKDTLILL